MPSRVGFAALLVLAACSNDGTGIDDVVAVDRQADPTAGSTTVTTPRENPALDPSSSTAGSPTTTTVAVSATDSDGLVRSGVAAQEFLASVFLEADVAYLGPCRLGASDSEADTCSLEAEAVPGRDEYQIMVGPAGDYTGDPDSPFASDFGVSVVTIGAVPSGWEYRGLVDIGLPVDVAGSLSPSYGGLGIGLRFGSTLPDSMLMLESVLGGATSDSGWTSTAECAGMERRVSWGGLMAVFVDATGDRPEFAAYRLEEGLPSEVMIYLGPGASVSELRGQYGDWVSEVIDDPQAGPFVTVEGPLWLSAMTYHLDSDDPDRIEAVSAGESCGL